MWSRSNFIGQRRPSPRHFDASEALSLSPSRERSDLLVILKRAERKAEESRKRFSLDCHFSIRMVTANAWHARGRYSHADAIFDAWAHPRFFGCAFRAHLRMTKSSTSHSFIDSLRRLRRRRRSD